MMYSFEVISINQSINH